MVKEVDCRNLAPAPRGSTQIHSFRDTLEYSKLFVHLEQLESRTSSPSLLLCEPVIYITLVLRALTHLQIYSHGSYNIQI